MKPQHDDTNPNIFADAFNNRLSLHLSGSFQQGGIAVLRMGDDDAELLTLPLAEWAVLAILAMAKLEAPPLSVEGFLSANRLSLHLEKHGVTELSDAQNAIRIVHRLRRRLDTTKTRQHLTTTGLLSEGQSLAKRLVRRSRVLGYALGLDPANVSLTIANHQPQSHPQREM